MNDHRAQWCVRLRQTTNLNGIFVIELTDLRDLCHVEQVPFDTEIVGEI
jgi:hypothetical protein